MLIKRNKKIKKSVTPIIAVIMLLLTTLFLSGMVMVMISTLSKKSEVKIKKQISNLEIDGKIKNAHASPNSEEFTFTLINYFKSRLPVDNINTRITLYVNNYPIICDISETKLENECYCFKVLKNGEEISLEKVKQGLLPNVPYKFYCKNEYKPFNLIDEFKVGWFYMADMRLLDLEPVIVG